VFDLVAEDYGLKVEDLCLAHYRGFKYPHYEAHRVAVGLLRDHFGMTFASIGALLRKSIDTFSKIHMSCEKDRRSDPDFNARYERLKVWLEELD